MAERQRAQAPPHQQQQQQQQLAAMQQQQQQQQQQQPVYPYPYPQHQHHHHPHHPAFARAPLSAAELPLSLASLLLLLRDAEFLAARYGSTAAACARLEELEHAHVEAQAQLAALQQKLTHAALRQAAPFDVDALLGFVQGHVACRGSLALLQPVLLDFQRSLALPPDARFPSRDVLLSVQEIVGGTGTSAGNNAGSPQQVPLDTQHVFVHAATDAPSPMPLDGARKKRHPDLTRLTPKDKAPTASPTRANGSSPATSSGGTTAPRLIAPAGGRASAPAKSASADLHHQQQRARQEEKQDVTAAAMLSALSRPNGSGAVSSAATGRAVSATAAATATATTTAKAAERAAAKPTTTRRGQSANNAVTTSAAITATANAAAAQQKKRASQRQQDEPQATTAATEAPSVDKPADSADGAVGTRKRSTAALAAAASHEVVVKQNLSLPHDKRNIVELKQSSQHLTLENLEELNRRAPWDDVYKLRTTFSHVLDFASLDEPARKWFLGALRVQFVWRREFWERLHWLPMSETVCSGARWERYRQTRKRRANKAIAAWRKVYSDSLELMRQRQLPEDVWCDVALWYMPSTPLYWLPNSPDLVAELALVDAKHPVRCYFVQDFRKHPFYNDDDIQRKYPRQFALPAPQMLALQHEDKESRVNITPE